MTGFTRSAALVSAWTLLGFGAPSAPGWAADTRPIHKSDLRFDLSALTPESRETLGKIEVLLLDDENVHRVWQLGRRPESADVVIVACSPRCLSTDIFEALASWAKNGKGLLLEASSTFMASRFLLPEDYFIEPDYLTFATGRSWLDPSSPLTANVFQVKKELWCTRNGKGRLHLRSRSPDEDDLEKALLDRGEAFFPVLAWNGEARPSTTFEGATSEGGRPAGVESRIREGDMPVLLASTYQGARVLWYAHDFRPKRDCLPEFDDVRLWSNLVHWLAGEELPEEAADPGTGQ